MKNLVKLIIATTIAISTFFLKSALLMLFWNSVLCKVIIHSENMITYPQAMLLWLLCNIITLVGEVCWYVVKRLYKSVEFDA